MLKKTNFFALSALALFPLTAEAAYVSNINLTGNFALSGFNPYIDTDANPFTYNLVLTDLSGTAVVQIPDASENVSWISSGDFSAVAGPNSVLPEFNWVDQAFNLNDFGTITPGTYSFDFTNQVYTVTSGASTVDLGSIGNVAAGLNSILNLNYQITALDADGLLNDVLISFNEQPLDPVLNLSGLINYFDSLPTSGIPGSIDGTFAFNFSAQSVSNDVSEPMTLSLIGMGIAGMVGLRRRKKA